jgi:hypothetical protein
MDGLLKPAAEGDDQLRAAAAAPGTAHQSLRAGQVRPLLTEALARWQAAGVDTSGLRGIDVRIADLGGLTLGKADGRVIWLDDNAAGWGWFADRTPRSDSEFTRPGNQGEQNRMDLLTVLEHEVGHLLGREHEADGVMQATLTAGTRRTAGPAVAADRVGPGVDLTGLAWADESSGMGGRPSGHSRQR